MFYCVAMNAWLHTLATANPPLYVTQEQAYAQYAGLFDLAPAEDALYRRLLLEGPVRGRFVGMDATAEATETDPDALQARFTRHARRTAVDAAQRALAQAGLSAAELGGLVVNTCTGYLCPGLSSYLAQDLGMEHDVRSLDIAGMGCGAALPNLEASVGLLHASGARPMLSVAVEICTATLFMGPDPGLIVSNSIFGDGAAATVLMAGDDARAAGACARWRGSASVLHPEHREQLRYRLQQGRLRNHLTVKVPVIGAHLAARALARLLQEQALALSDIRWWAVHAGGTAVLDQVEKTLGLDASHLQYSRAVFEKYGNMSSPSALFALDSIVREGRPAAGDLGVLLAFGAGFSAFAVLLEFTGVS